MKYFLLSLGSWQCLDGTFHLPTSSFRHYCSFVTFQGRPRATFGYILGLRRFFCPCYEAFWTAPSSLALKNMVLHAKRVGKPDIYLATGVALSSGGALALDSRLVEVLVAPLHSTADSWSLALVMCPNRALRARNSSLDWTSWQLHSATACPGDHVPLLPCLGSFNSKVNTRAVIFKCTCDKISLNCSKALSDC